MKVHVSSLHAPIYRNFYLCFGKKKVLTLRCGATRESLCANGSVPCTAAKTIAWTKLANFVWQLKKIRGFPHETPTIRNRFNLISEERVKIFKQNSENVMKIGWKIRKLWHFEVSQIFTKHFLTSRYEYEWVDDVIASLLAIYFVHKILKILIFCPKLW